MSDTTHSPPTDQPSIPADPGGQIGTPDRSQSWLLWSVVLPLIIVLAAGSFRFYRLGSPERCYFDETYYYYDARDYLEFGTESSFAVHPPVGKWLIAGGLAAFGVAADSPIDQAITVQDDNCLVDDDEGPNAPARAREGAEAFARRVMSAVFGTGSVVLAYFIGLRLFRRRAAALLGAALLATDGLAVTMSRISMLDIFLQFFVLLSVLALLIDRDRLWRDTPPHPFTPADGEAAKDVPVPARNRTWLWLGGAFMGLALATKWSALAPLGLSWAFVLASELWWRRRLTGTWRRGLLKAVSRGFLALVLVPILVYLASYGGWFANFEDTRKADRCATDVAAAEDSDTATIPELPEAPANQTPVCEGLDIPVQIAAGWWEEQGEIFRFHRDLEAEHPYRASAWTWALMLRPVAYYYESCPADRPADEEVCEVNEGTVAEVLGLGNPGMWWMALIGYPFLIFLAFARRSWPAMMIALFLFGQSLPYLLSPRPVFLFYMTPAVPFIALSLAYLADKAMDSASLKWVPATIAVVALGSFGFWAPVFLGIEIPRDIWDTLILFPSWV